MKKLKIAVQMFGNLRTFDQCAPILKKRLLNNYDCDIFMHTWDTIDHQNPTWHNFQIKREALTAGQIEKEIKKLYPITRLKIESQGKPDKQDEGLMDVFDRKISIFGMKSMMKSIKSANDLRISYQEEKGVEYDFIVAIRPDIMLLKPLKIEKYFERLSENEINNSLFTSGFNMLSINNEYRLLGATDVLFFATPKAFNCAVGTYSNALQKMRDSKGTRIEFGPEYYIIEEFEKTGNKAFYIDFKLGRDFEIIRQINRSLLRQLLVIKIKLNLIDIKFLPYIRSKIFNFSLTFSGLFKIFISIGRR